VEIENSTLATAQAAQALGAELKALIAAEETLLGQTLCDLPGSAMVVKLPESATWKWEYKRKEESKWGFREVPALATMRFLRMQASNWRSGTFELNFSAGPKEGFSPASSCKYLFIREQLGGLPTILALIKAELETQAQQTRGDAPAAQEAAVALAQAAAGRIQQ